MNLELPSALAARVEKLAKVVPLAPQALAIEAVEEGLRVLEEVGRHIETPPEDEAEPIISRGIVRFFDTKKFWGIVTDATGEGVFLHGSALGEGGTVAAGDRLEYRIERNTKGPTAKNVKVLERAKVHGSDLDEWRREKYSI
jgi:cold shock CspA family protein